MWSPVSFIKVARNLSPAWPLDLARRRIEFDCLLTRPLAGTRIGAGTLSAYRQTLAVAQATPGAQIHQSLDVHRHFAAQIAFHRPLRHLRADRGHFGLG